MNIRTFQGESMAAALKQVKRELGGEAVILHTRTFRRGGLLGFGTKRVVEVTASTEVSIVPPKMRRQVLAGDNQGSLPQQPVRITGFEVSVFILGDNSSAVRGTLPADFTLDPSLDQ